MKIKKGDKVRVITGHEKGIIGEVLACLPKQNKVVVEGVNIRKICQKPNQINPDGGIVNKECPIDVSNVVKADEKKSKGKDKKDKKGGKK